jgi:hypothetical protein
VASERRDFFVSYNRQDQRWAEWIAWQLESASYSTYIQAWDFDAGSNFVLEMQKAAACSERTIAVLSPNYLRSLYTQPEWAAAFAQDPTGQRRALVPVRVADCALAGLLAQIVYIDLLGLDADAARQRLLDEIRPGSKRPTQAPVFPVAASGTGAAQAPCAAAVFPGAANPYLPWTPSANRFAGRCQLIRRLESALEEGRSVSVVGDWRIGKTSLLLRWQREAQKRGRVVRLLDAEKREGASLAAFVTAITGHACPAEADPAADALDRWVASVSQPGLPPVILVDETDCLIGRFDYRFFERIRGMLERLAWVFASRQELDALFEQTGRGSPLANRLEIQWLALVEPEAADEIIGWGQGVLTADDAAGMRQWAGRHPFYLQLLGHHLFYARHTGGTQSEALDRFRNEASARLRRVWNTLNDRDRQALRDSPVTPAPRLRLRMRGLVTEEGRPFGDVLTRWMEEEL